MSDMTIGQVVQGAIRPQPPLFHNSNRVTPAQAPFYLRALQGLDLIVNMGRRMDRGCRSPAKPLSVSLSGLCDHAFPTIEPATTFYPL